jgi:hypothetical protein
VAAFGQNGGDYLEVASPNAAPGEGFGWLFGDLPDLTGDGVGEFFAVGGGLYVFDGGTLELHWKLDAIPGCDVGRTTGSAGDLTGDGIPDLLVGIYGYCNDRRGQVNAVDGATGAFLFTLRSPDPVTQGFFGETIRLLPDMTGDGREDWLIHQPEWGSRVGRVYVFDSQTHQVVRTIRNRDQTASFFVQFVEVIPDVDGDGTPELLISSFDQPVRQGGRTISNAGRALVRSLETGQVLYELHDPEPKTNGRFGEALQGIGDVTGDGIGDIAIGTHFKDNETGVLYLFSGADGAWLRTLRSPNPRPKGKFGRKIESLPDLNGDGVPELWTQEDEFNLTYVYDGATSDLLQTVEYPGPLGPLFFIGTVRQTAPPGIRAYLFGSEFVSNKEGRVYYMPFTPLPQPVRILAEGRTDHGFRLRLTGDLGEQWQVEATSDFRVWEALGAVTTGAEPLEFLDSDVDLPQRFYRLVKQP